MSTRKASMSTRRAWAGRIAPGVEAAINQLTEDVDKGGQGLRSPTQIQKALEALFPEKPELVPDTRTIKRRLKRLSPPPDDTGRWKLADATDAEAAAVMPVLAVHLWRTGGLHPYLTQRQAELVCRVRAAAPDLPDWAVYDTASAYCWREKAKGTPDERTEDLDSVLALRAWQPGAYGLFLAWVGSHHPDWLSQGHTELVRVADGRYHAVPFGTVDGTWLAARLYKEGLKEKGIREIRRRPYRRGDTSVLLTDPWEVEVARIDSQADSAEGGSHSAAEGQQEG